MSHIFIPVSLTAKAALEIKKIKAAKHIDSAYLLRVGVKATGCHGHTPIIGFDKQKPTDMQYEQEGILMVVDKKQVLHLTGKQVDFISTEEESGFVFLEEA